MPADAHPAASRPARLEALLASLQPPDPDAVTARVLARLAAAGLL